uniref:Uncharacterized protein n=1 Tax=Picea glauca TaxID=3330 RepID=A0A101LZ20_PICGL|nr:hypothetical protein ABT39_MTgene4976 [Picea glauca]QHR86596.1 hypothetical protein Q903MT_gene599 [Picea sitchensis]
MGVQLLSSYVFRLAFPLVMLSCWHSDRLFSSTDLLLHSKSSCLPLNLIVYKARHTHFQSMPLVIPSYFPLQVKGDWH